MLIPLFLAFSALSTEPATTGQSSPQELLKALLVCCEKGDHETFFFVLSYPEHVKTDVDRVGKEGFLKVVKEEKTLEAYHEALEACAKMPFPPVETSLTGEKVHRFKFESALSGIPEISLCRVDKRWYLSLR